MLTTKLTAIADAIRSKTGETATMTLADMPNKISGISGSEDVEWHQCPELVRNYLANVTYDAGDYTTSQIANYAPSTAVESNYRPVGVTVGAETYYNQEPNVQTPFANSAKAGTLKPLDRLRYIKTTAHNVRDLGGWACDGGTVKYGLLFRGGEIGAAAIPTLVDECGVRHELNLRGQAEASRTESPLGSNIYFTCPENFVWYDITDKATWNEILTCVINAVIHYEPVYFHCSAGADRTGTVACILEGMLGMSQSDIDKDYELTCFYSGTDTAAHARRRNESDWTGLINQINSHSGSTFRDKIVNFVTSCGIPISMVNAYRAAMIDGTPEVLTGGTHTITNNLTNATNANTATSIEDQAAYTATLTANSGYAISTVTITMGGNDASSYYSNGTINIPNVTGDIVITAVAEAIVYEDIEVYTPTNAQINKKFSGTSIVAANGSYVTAAVALDLTQYRYLKINGAMQSGKSDGAILYKIGFIKGGSIIAVAYSNNLVLSSESDTKWTADLSKQADYTNYDSLCLMFTVSSSAITASDVLTAAQVQVTATTSV